MKFRKIVNCLVSILFLLGSKIFGQTDFQKQRMEMVQDQIINRGIYHKATLEAMREVPRHLFVPQPLRGLAYRDQPLSIGKGQTISQPYIVAFMTAAIKPDETMKVLEIGTGSGYQAAVLAQIVDTVYTIEIVEALGKRAAQKIAALGYDNVVSKIGDGYQGWREHAPFDAILVTAAPEQIPPPLLGQLAEGGRMVIPVGPAFLAQELTLVHKKKGRIKKRRLLPVRFVPFKRN